MDDSLGGWLGWDRLDGCGRMMGICAAEGDGIVDAVRAYIYDHEMAKRGETGQWHFQSDGTIAFERRHNGLCGFGKAASNAIVKLDARHNWYC